MKFGFSVPPVGPGERSDAENYKRVIEDCRLAHSLGYDAAWGGHNRRNTPDPASMMTCAVLPLSTSQIRIVLSCEEVASHRSSGDHAMLVTDRI